MIKTLFDFKIEKVSGLPLSSNDCKFAIKWQRGHKLQNSGFTESSIAKDNLCIFDKTFPIKATIFRNENTKYNRKNISFEFHIISRKNGSVRCSESTLNLADIIENDIDVPIKIPLEMKLYSRSKNTIESITLELSVLIRSKVEKSMDNQISPYDIILSLNTDIDFKGSLLTLWSESRTSKQFRIELLNRLNSENKLTSEKILMIQCIIDFIGDN
jgi:hypothetical protein